MKGRKEGTEGKKGYQWKGTNGRKLGTEVYQGRKEGRRGIEGGKKV